jgi:two-component system chemotaxis response regulator CheB
MSSPIRVLVVDDSAFARKVVREILSADPRIEVLGIARDGLEALECISELNPDVITLDLVMPNLDGVGVLRALPPNTANRVVIVSISDADSELGVEALQLGAFDLVHKPSSLATVRLYDLRDELIERVVAAASSGPRPVKDEETRGRLAPGVQAAAAGTADVVVIGTSTGGPQALTRLLTSLPADFPVPLAIALHIPAGYTESLARRLDAACTISVVEAAEGTILRPGLAVLARGGMHLKLQRTGADVLAQPSATPSPSTYTPSVDVLFESAAEAYGSHVLGVVMTGMGQDGMAGSKIIAAAGGTILSESESSCVVYGMPRAVWEAGLVTERATLDLLGSKIVKRVGEGRGG